MSVKNTLLQRSTGKLERNVYSGLRRFEMCLTTTKQSFLFIYLFIFLHTPGVRRQLWPLNKHLHQLGTWTVWSDLFGGTPGLAPPMLLHHNLSPETNKTSACLNNTGVRETVLGDSVIHDEWQGKQEPSLDEPSVVFTRGGGTIPISTQKVNKNEIKIITWWTWRV